MANPFADKFLKAGLVSKKQANKAKHEKRQGRKKKNDAGDETAAANKARQEQEALKKRSKELNRQRSEEQRQRELQAQVKQLIEQNRLERDDRGGAYYFKEENKAKRIFVNDQMADQLSRGQLAIVKLGRGYEVVPAKVARQISGRDKQAVVAFHEEGK